MTTQTQAGTRAAIADVLNEIDGITGYPQHPGGPTVAGSAWPVWVRSEYLDVGGCHAETEWDVVVVLPSGSFATPINAADDLRQTVAEALHRSHVGTVRYAEPVALNDEGKQPAARFRVSTATH